MEEKRGQKAYTIWVRNVKIVICGYSTFHEAGSVAYNAGKQHSGVLL